MKDFFYKLLNVSVKEHYTDIEKKRIKLLNLASYIAFFHAIFFLFFDFFLGILDSQKLISLTIETFIFSAIIFLQYKAFLKLSRWVFTTIVFVSLYYNCNYAFVGFYGEYQYIVFPLFSLFLFDKKYIHYAILVLSILAFYVPNYFLTLYPDQYFGYANVFLIFTGNFLLVNYFKIINDKNEALLKTQNTQILKDKALLEEQKIELNKLNNFKSHFFVNISHEIRTPITLIKGYIPKIKIDKHNIESINNLNIIKKQTQHIQDLVDNILDLSKLEITELEIKKEAVELLNFVEKIFIDFKALFIKKGIDFILETKTIPDLIKIDPNFFTKGINNLLLNALKFTPNHGRAILRIDVIDDNLEISVIDNGIGIPSQDLEKVFDRFYQSKNDIAQSQGSGIGLSFTKSIVEAHGFQLQLKSTPNKETSFTIIVPPSCFVQSNDKALSEVINKEKIQDPKEYNDSDLSKQGIFNPANKTVLIVEDNEEMRTYLKLVLKGYNIVEAINGKEGLKAIQKYSFDTIITDYMMPVMDGLTFVREIKKCLIKTPVIVLTARNDEKGRLDILRLGIDTYLTKPFLEEELLLNLKSSILFYDEIKNFRAKLPAKEKIQLAGEETVFLNELKLVINNNYQNKNFGVDILAEKLELSRSSLFRKTKVFLGQTPNEVIGEVRFQKAKNILVENPKIKKKELAEAVGIYNATYFYKKLEERFDMKS